MHKIILYTIGCPACKKLEQKLIDRQIEFEICDDTGEMSKLEITSVPYLSVDGELLNFGKAWKWADNISNN